jgi:2-polyprenyl-6-methoxyphenol hydroxylase-like FAD-dependent oxidoreductase
MEEVTRSTPGTVGPSTREVDVCIVGGGPAGLVLALLLAGRGIRVLVLERHGTFARDLRGEILQPRFTQLMRQIGLFDYISQFPHERIDNVELVIDHRTLFKVQYQKVSPDAPFMMWMTQPTLLNALHLKGQEFPSYELWFHANVDELIREDGRVVGARVVTESQTVDVRAKVVVGADGRSSTIRKLMGAELEYELHNVDVLWFLLDRPAEHTEICDLFVADDRSYLLLPKHPNELQCGILFRPGEFNEVKKRGIEAFKHTLAQAHPVIAEFVKTVQDFGPFTFLQGKASFVRNWATDGCLLIGDAAHTCSPAGGIGVAVAVATAIVAAETLVLSLEKNDFSKEFLSRVQRLRSSEIRRIHRRQYLFTTCFVTYVKLTRRLAPWLVPVISVFGGTGRTARAMLTQPPLPLTSPMAVP